MSDLFEEIEKLDAGRKKKRPSPGDIATGLGSVPDLTHRVEVATETGAGKRHGRYAQYTMRLDAAVVEEIKAWASQLGLPDTQTYRWIVARGLLALRDGERPTINYRQVADVQSPLE